MAFNDQVREILTELELGISSCRKRSITTFVTAMLFHLGGLTALSFSYVVLAAAMFLFGLHFTMHYFRHLVIDETMQQTRTIVHVLKALGLESHQHPS